MTVHPSIFNTLILNRVVTGAGAYAGRLRMEGGLDPELVIGQPRGTYRDDPFTPTFHMRVRRVYHDPIMTILLIFIRFLGSFENASFLFRFCISVLIMEYLSDDPYRAIRTCMLVRAITQVTKATVPC